MEQHGAKDWSLIATKLTKLKVFRVGKQCRERWFNHLSPDVRKDAWTKEEDMVILRAHAKFGNKWTRIASMLEGISCAFCLFFRTPSECD